MRDHTQFDCHIYNTTLLCYFPHPSPIDIQPTHVHVLFMWLQARLQRYKEDWTCKDGARGKLFLDSCLGLEQRAKGMKLSLGEIGQGGAC